MRTSETSEIVKQEIGYTREIIHKQIDSLAEALERTGNREVLCALNTEIFNR